MKAISTVELKELLERQRGASFVTIIARTKPQFIGGKSSPMVGVEKVSRVNGVVNWSYQNAVNNQRTREGQPLDEQGEVEFFEPEPRSWGQRLHDEVGRLLPTVEHKGRTYLELKVQKSIEYSFYRDDQRIPNEEVLPHLRKNTEGRRQEVDNPVILRDYALDSIKAIRLDGELYVVQ
ncbi:MAG: hypothetical protein DWQ19_12915 [Crenarchaeota archaeon]|nr:MAG: hypothetical protein DWQ19_12915 [Thermoproteota archaeon]